MLPVFFASATELDQWSRQLDALGVVCPHCQRAGHLVGHGHVYRKACGGQRVSVGKRIRCSARHGRAGCGRTVRLYLEHRIPALQYGADAVHRFVLALLTGRSVTRAYHHATGALTPRHAWRWMNRLRGRLHEWRSRLASVASQARFGPFAILLPMLAAWLHDTTVATCQTTRQMAFF